MDNASGVGLPKTPSFRLDGKRALVTGAGRGIGLAAAAALAEAGAGVTLVARTKTEIEAAANDIRASGGKAEAAVLDVTDIEAVRAFVVERRAVRHSRQQCRLEPPGAVRRGEGRGLRLHPEAQRALGLFRRAGGRETADRGEAARLDHQHVLADGPCRRRAPHRLLRQQACDRGLHQSDGVELAPVRHPRQFAGADLHRDADDAAVLRRTRRSGARCWTRSSLAGSARSRT